MINYNESESVLIHNVKDNGLSVKKILESNIQISGRLLRKLHKSKSILLNGKIAKLGDETKGNDIITIIMEDERDPNCPQDVPLDIIYEDFDVIALNKQPYMVVHPTKSHDDNTLANGLVAYFIKNNIRKKVRFVNRLDMDTSGILLVAKNPFSHQSLSEQLESNYVEKEYLALVEGVVEKDHGIIDKPIGKEGIKNVITEEGKPSITKYHVVERYNKGTLLKVKIETGRTHQIRVHLDSIGHPIIGDSLYNKTSDLIKRQALHSFSLVFKQPRTNEKIELEAKLPEDMRRVIEAIK